MTAPQRTVELDVCPVCGYVRRASGPSPGLCTETFTHPAAAVTVSAPPASTTKVMTAGLARTTLVRVHASWTMPAA